MGELILQAHNLYKAFNKNVALNHIDLDIPKGTIFGLLGPNGAGKTTLIRLITRIFEPDEGHITFDGMPLNRASVYDIGYMPEERGLYKSMKVGEQLIYLARLKDMSGPEARDKIKYWMDKLEIADWWNKKVEELSKGMQQKIQFVATVLHEPKLLILDEPFSGLDPVNSNIIKEEIRELNRKGTSIIFSTHRMEQVEDMCQDIVLINKGEVILNGAVKDIRNQFKKNHYLISYEGDYREDQLPNGFALISKGEQTLTFRLEASQNANTLMKSLLNHRWEIHGVTEILPSLNEIFIQQVETRKHQDPIAVS